eukprot:tig00020941_g16235.t1
MPPKEKGKAQQTVIGKDASGNISFRAPAQPIAGSSDAPAAAPAPAAAQGPRTDADDFEPMDSHLWLKRQIHILTSWVWQGDKIIQGKLHGKKAAMCLLNKEKHGRQFACKTVFKNISATSSIDSHFNTQHGLFAPTDGESAQHAAGQATLGPAFEAVKPLSDEDNLAKHHALARAIVTGMLPFSVASAHWMRGWALALNPSYRPTDRGTIRRIILAEHARQRKSVRSMLFQGANRIYDVCHATSDIWTSEGRKSYISFTIHWLDELFNLHTRCLEVARFSDAHAAVNIKQALRK